MITTRRTYLSRAFLGATSAGLIGALGACGAPGAGGSQQPAASAQPATIRFPEDASSPTDMAFAQDFVTRFNAKGGNVKVQLEDFPDPDWGKRYEKYTAMAIAGTMPEIIWLCCSFIRPFMVNGQALALDQFIKRDWKQGEIDDFYKGPFDAMKVDNKQFGIPVYVNTNIMFVNKGHLKEAGLQYPDESWDKNKFLDYTTKPFGGVASGGATTCASMAPTATSPSSGTPAPSHTTPRTAQWSPSSPTTTPRPSPPWSSCTT